MNQGILKGWEKWTDLPPIFISELLNRYGLISWRLLLHFIFVVFFANDLQVDLVLARNIALLLEQQSGIPIKYCIEVASRRLDSTMTYSTRAPNTKRMHANIQASIAVSPSALGVLVVTLLKMLTSTRNRVTRRAILPGITSIGIRNEIQDTITKRPREE